MERKEVQQRHLLWAIRRWRLPVHVDHAKLTVDQGSWHYTFRIECEHGMVFFRMAGSGQTAIISDSWFGKPTEWNPDLRPPYDQGFVARLRDLLNFDGDLFMYEEKEAGERPATTWINLIGPKSKLTSFALESSTGRLLKLHEDVYRPRIPPVLPKPRKDLPKVPPPIWQRKKTHSDSPAEVGGR